MVNKKQNLKKERSMINNQLSIIKFFLVWRVLLFAFFFLGVSTLPLQLNFLGGGLSNYLGASTLWSWANFDGEHYLAIAKNGYVPLTYFFFPLYPIFIKFFERFFSGDFSYLYSGLLVSHGFFIIGLYGFVKLIRLDYKEKIVNLSLLTLLLFPTSYFFGSVYTESLFFALVVWAFYFARTGNFLLAGILGGLSTSTRIIGLALIPAFAFEYFFVNQKNIESGRHLSFTPVKLISLALISSGLLIYMYFLSSTAGDPLAFFHNLSNVFGEQRSTYLVSLPQVFYRYFVKILPNVNYDYFPAVFTTLFELLVGILLSVLSIFSFYKLRLSYALYLLASFLIPTFSGSFSSLPRYALVSFPAFILLALYFNKINPRIRVVLYSALAVLLAISTMLFTRGYWVS